MILPTLILSTLIIKCRFVGYLSTPPTGNSSHLGLTIITIAPLHPWALNYGMPNQLFRILRDSRCIPFHMACRPFRMYHSVLSLFSWIFTPLNTSSQGPILKSSLQCWQIYCRFPSDHCNNKKLYNADHQITATVKRVKTIMKQMPPLPEVGGYSCLDNRWSSRLLYLVHVDLSRSFQTDSFASAFSPL